MAKKAIGIINLSPNQFQLRGLNEFRPISATSFLGRYRVIDFQLSNLSNSDIDNIHIHVNHQAKSIADHVGTGRHYNINSKKGRLNIFYQEEKYSNEMYHHDINAFRRSIREIELSNAEYVVITPGHIVCKMNFEELLENHEASGADVTAIYKSVKNGPEYVGLDRLKMNKQGGLEAIRTNRGDNENVDVSLETYILAKDLFLDIIGFAELGSTLYWFKDAISNLAHNLDIRCVEHKGYYACISSLENYFKTNMELLDHDVRSELFTEDWQFYTKTTDAQPTLYSKDSKVSNTLVANGCIIDGVVKNSIIGRNVIIEAGAEIENSIIFSNSYITADSKIKNTIIDRFVRVENVKEIGNENISYIRRDDIV